MNEKKVSNKSVERKEGFLVKKKAKEKRRLPAEWEEQGAVLLTFPHKSSDWRYCLKDVRETFIAIIEAILDVQKCVVIVDGDGEKVLKNRFGKNVGKNLLLVNMPSNDTWSRDFGGITIESIDSKKAKKYIVLDFIFNGWGMKFASNFDNLITRGLKSREVLKNRVESVHMILEGGSIDSNGEGILLTNRQCLLEENRNSGLSQNEIEKRLKNIFGLRKIIWLTKGYLAGDDTDSHIDTLARFVDKNSIAYLKCEDKNDEHYAELLEMEMELKNARNLKNEPFNLIPLPLNRAIYHQGKNRGERLPASYANFLFINGALLLPTYNQSSDKIAMEILSKAVQIGRAHV